MGGIDILDNFVAKYRIAVEGKKWSWPLFVNFVDVTLCNACNLRRVVHGKALHLLEFQCEDAVSLLKTATEELSTTSLSHNPQLTGRPSSYLTSFGDPSSSSSKHYIAKTADGHHIRCRECKSTTLCIYIQCAANIHAAERLATYNGH